MTRFALALAAVLVSSSAQAASLTFTGNLNLPNTGDAPETLRWQLWVPLQPGITRHIAEFTMTDYGPQTHVLDETTAVAAGVDWEALNDDIDGNLYLFGVGVGDDPSTDAQFRMAPSGNNDPGYYLLEFTFDRVELVVNSWDASAPHAISFTATVFGDGTPYDIPEPAGAVLTLFGLLAVCGHSSRHHVPSN